MFSLTILIERHHFGFILDKENQTSNTIINRTNYILILILTQITIILILMLNSKIKIAIIVRKH